VRLLQDWQLREVVERGAVVIELDLLDAKQSTPVRLIAQTILERTGASSSVMKSSIASGS